MKELKYFEKVFLKAGETKTIRFEISPMRDLSFPDGDGVRYVESGDFYLLVKEQKLKFQMID